MVQAAQRLRNGMACAAVQLQPLYLRNKVALTVSEQQALRKGKPD
jgi:hypothetical protein